MSQVGHLFTNERLVGEPSASVGNVGGERASHDVCGEVEPALRIELRTPSLRKTCSTTELSGLGGERPTPRRGRRQEPVPGRFWPKVDKSGGADACWPWVAHCGADGYGRINIAGKPRLAHRIAYVLAGGTIPDSLEMRHSRRCTTRACCNPSHLTPGTHQENMDDTVAMGRTTAGTRHPKAKLTDSLVVYAREAVAAGARKSTVARQLHVSEKLIRDVVAGRGWAHVGASR